MKFSFDSSGYRDNLAKELVEKRKESPEAARLVDEEKKDTVEYQLAKDIKHVSRKIGEKKPDSLSRPTEIEKRDINDEFEIITYDISRIIPKNVQIYFDKIRLAKTQEEFNEYALVGDYYATVDEASWFCPDKTFDDDDYIFRRRAFEESLESEEKEDILKYRKEIILNKLKKYKKIIDHSAKDFIDGITDGSFYDPKILTHVIEGDTKNELTESEKRKPHVNKELKIPEEKEFNPSNNSLTGLYFTAGGSDVYFNPMKIVVMCDSENKKLEDITMRVSTTTKSNHKNSINSELPVSEQIKIGTDYAYDGHVGGIYIGFNEYKTWEEVADYIVDLYHAKLYKIQRKTNASDIKLDTLSSKETMEKPTKEVCLTGVDMKKINETENESRLEFGIPKSDIDFWLYRGEEYSSGKNYIEKRKSEDINTKNKYAQIFNCQPSQVILFGNEANQDTVVYVGNSKRGDILGTLPKLQYIIGNIENYFEESDNNLFENLTYVSGDMVVNHNIPTKLKRVGGDLSIRNNKLFEIPEDFISELEYIGGDFDFNSASKISSTTLDKIKNITKGKIRKEGRLYKN